jgi:hypothetical protein
VVAGLPAAAHADDEPIIIVDLRPGDPASLATSRATLQDELGAIQGITILRGADLDGALSGAAVDLDAARVTTALAEARTAFGALDCKKASAAADRAIEDLAARQAAGLDDGPALRSAYAYVVLCADRDGDLDTALRAAGRLRALGVTSGDDVGISAATWAKLPEVDVTGAEIVALTIDADQPGATVWVDHAPAGAAPVTVYLSAGEHVIAAGKSGARAATRLSVAGVKKSVSLSLLDQKGTWSEVAGLIHAWRDKVSSPTNAGLTSVMAAAKVRFAIVLAGARTAEVWGKPARDPIAKKLDTASADSAMELGAIIVDRVAAWDGRAPDGELLRETAEERAALYGGQRGETKAKWYVYASIAGAVLIGGLVIYSNEAATDRQRITITGP